MISRNGKGRRQRLAIRCCLAPVYRIFGIVTVAAQTMKKLIALTVVAFALQVVSTSAGEVVASSKEVAAPQPSLPPISYFRSNEFSLGLFGSYGWTYHKILPQLGITPGAVVLTGNTSRSSISAWQ
jgi:hypothetical protein